MPCQRVNPDLQTQYRNHIGTAQNQRTAANNHIHIEWNVPIKKCEIMQSHHRQHDVFQCCFKTIVSSGSHYKRICNHTQYIQTHILPQQNAQLNCTHNYRTIQNTVSMIYKQASIMPNSYNISEIQRERFHWCFASWYNNDNNNILDYLIVVHSKSLAKHVINKQTDITHRWSGVQANYSKRVRYFCRKKLAHLTRPSSMLWTNWKCLLYR